MHLIVVRMGTTSERKSELDESMCDYILDSICSRLNSCKLVNTNCRFEFSIPVLDNGRLFDIIKGIGV